MEGGSEGSGVGLVGDLHITLKVYRSHLVGQAEVWHDPYIVGS